MCFGLGRRSGVCPRFFDLTCLVEPWRLCVLLGILPSFIGPSSVHFFHSSWYTGSGDKCRRIALRVWAKRAGSFSSVERFWKFKACCASVGGWIGLRGGCLFRWGVALGSSCFQFGSAALVAVLVVVGLLM